MSYGSALNPSAGGSSLAMRFFFRDRDRHWDAMIREGWTQLH
jgi:hypothetical protein